jgi:glycine cleavage system H protein
MSNYPENLHYTSDHEWAKESEDGQIVVGITAFAVEQLGDITLVELPEVGREFAAGEAFGTVESVKSVSDLYAPISGKVVATNSALEGTPELINTSPYDKGWIVRFEPTEDEYEDLLDAAAYRELLAEEA